MELENNMRTQQTTTHEKWYCDPEQGEKLTNDKTWFYAAHPLHAQGICKQLNSLQAQRDELLAAAKLAVERLNQLKAQGDEDDWEAFKPLHHGLLSKLQSAIANAEGKQNERIR